MTAQQSTVFQVGDDLVDAWGQPQEEQDEAGSYESMSAKQLAEEIRRRNEDREEGDRIVLADNKKTTAVAALEADDQKE